MNTLLKLLSISTLALSLNLQAMEGPNPARGIDTYNGVVITRDNLLKLLPTPPAPVIDWVEKHKQEVGELAQLPADLSTYKEKIAKDKLVLLAMGLVNLSDSGNYIFKILDGKDIVQIGGVLNRLFNICYENELNPSKDKIDLKNLPKVPATFQAISRAAWNLRLQEATKNMKHVGATPTYVVHIPGKPTALDDNNYVVVQETVAHSSKLTPEVVKNLSVESIKELYAVIKHVGPWDFKTDNILIDEQSGKMIFIDLEPPNVVKPCKFFNKEPLRFEHLVSSGFKSLATMLKEQGNVSGYQTLRTLVVQDPELLNSSKKELYKEIFELE